MAATVALQNAGGGSLAQPGGAGNASRQQLEKASLDMYQAVPQKTGCDLGTALGSIPFQFNPKELTIAKSAKWERKPQKNSKTAGPPEFSGSDPCKLTLEMFFDATTKNAGGVVAAVESLFTCLVPTGETIGKKKAMPPLVIFHWGRTTSFPGFLTGVSAKYTLFAPDGTPIRAACSVTMEEMPPGTPKQNPTSGAIAAHRGHTVIAGDSLASLAYGEYGDATMWRALAAFNGIDDPLRIREGTALLLPPPEELLSSAARGR
jgi:hypothetical protein